MSNSNDDNTTNNNSNNNSSGTSVARKIASQNVTDPSSGNSSVAGANSPRNQLPQYGTLAYRRYKLVSKIMRVLFGEKEINNESLREKITNALNVNQIFLPGNFASALFEAKTVAAFTAQFRAALSGVTADITEDHVTRILDEILSESHFISIENVLEEVLDDNTAETIDQLFAFCGANHIQNFKQFVNVILRGSVEARTTFADLNVDAQLIKDIFSTGFTIDPTDVTNNLPRVNTNKNNNAWQTNPLDTARSIGGGSFTARSYVAINSARSYTASMQSARFSVQSAGNASAANVDWASEHGGGGNNNLSSRPRFMGAAAAAGSLRAEASGLSRTSTMNTAGGASTSSAHQRVSTFIRCLNACGMVDLRAAPLVASALHQRFMKRAKITTVGAFLLAIAEEGFSGVRAKLNNGNDNDAFGSDITLDNLETLFRKCLEITGLNQLSILQVLEYVEPPKNAKQIAAKLKDDLDIGTFVEYLEVLFGPDDTTAFKRIISYQMVITGALQIIQNHPPQSHQQENNNNNNNNNNNGNNNHNNNNTNNNTKFYVNNNNNNQNVDDDDGVASYQAGIEQLEAGLTSPYQQIVALTKTVNAAKSSVEARQLADKNVVVVEGSDRTTTANHLTGFPLIAKNNGIEADDAHPPPFHRGAGDIVAARSSLAPEFTFVEFPRTINSDQVANIFFNESILEDDLYRAALKYFTLGTAASLRVVYNLSVDHLKRSSAGNSAPLMLRVGSVSEEITNVAGFLESCLVLLTHSIPITNGAVETITETKFVSDARSALKDVISKAAQNKIMLTDQQLRLFQHFNTACDALYDSLIGSSVPVNVKMLLEIPLGQRAQANAATILDALRKVVPQQNHPYQASINSKVSEALRALVHTACGDAFQDFSRVATTGNVPQNSSSSSSSSNVWNNLPEYFVAMVQFASYLSAMNFETDSRLLIDDLMQKLLLLNQRTRTAFETAVDKNAAVQAQAELRCLEAQTEFVRRVEELVKARSATDATAASCESTARFSRAHDNNNNNNNGFDDDNNNSFARTNSYFDQQPTNQLAAVSSNNHGAAAIPLLNLAVIRPPTADASAATTASSSSGFGAIITKELLSSWFSNEDALKWAEGNLRARLRSKIPTSYQTAAANWTAFCDAVGPVHRMCNALFPDQGLYESSLLRDCQQWICAFLDDCRKAGLAALDATQRVQQEIYERDLREFELRGNNNNNNNNNNNGDDDNNSNGHLTASPTNEGSGSFIGGSATTKSASSFIGTATRNDDDNDDDSNNNSNKNVHAGEKGAGPEEGGFEYSAKHVVEQDQSQIFPLPGSNDGDDLSAPNTSNNNNNNNNNNKLIPIPTTDTVETVVSCLKLMLDAKDCLSATFNVIGSSISDYYPSFTHQVKGRLLERSQLLLNELATAQFTQVEATIYFCQKFRAFAELVASPALRTSLGAEHLYDELVASPIIANLPASPFANRSSIEDTTSAACFDYSLVHNTLLYYFIKLLATFDAVELPSQDKGTRDPLFFSVTCVRLAIAQRADAAKHDVLEKIARVVFQSGKEQIAVWGSSGKATTSSVAALLNSFRILASLCALDDLFVYFKDILSLLLPNFVSDCVFTLTEALRAQIESLLALERLGTTSFEQRAANRATLGHLLTADADDAFGRFLVAAFPESGAPSFVHGLQQNAKDSLSQLFELRRQLCEQQAAFVEKSINERMNFTILEEKTLSETPPVSPQVGVTSSLSGFTSNDNNNNNNMQRSTSLSSTSLLGAFRSNAVPPSSRSVLKSKKNSTFTCLQLPSVWAPNFLKYIARLKSLSALDTDAATAARAQMRDNISVWNQRLQMTIHEFNKLLELRDVELEASNDDDDEDNNNNCENNFIIENKKFFECDYIAVVLQEGLALAAQPANVVHELDSTFSELRLSTIIDKVVESANHFLNLLTEIIEESQQQQHQKCRDFIKILDQVFALVSNIEIRSDAWRHAIQQFLFARRGYCARTSKTKKSSTPSAGNGGNGGAGNNNNKKNQNNDNNNNNHQDPNANGNNNNNQGGNNNKNNNNNGASAAPAYSDDSFKNHLAAGTLVGFNAAFLPNCFTKLSSDLPKFQDLVNQAFVTFLAEIEKSVNDTNDFRADNRDANALLEKIIDFFEFLIKIVAEFSEFADIATGTKEKLVIIVTRKFESCEEKLMAAFEGDDYAKKLNETLFENVFTLYNFLFNSLGVKLTNGPEGASAEIEGAIQQFLQENLDKAGKIDTLESCSHIIQFNAAFAEFVSNKLRFSQQQQGGSSISDLIFATQTAFVKAKVQPSWESAVSNFSKDVQSARKNKNFVKMIQYRNVKAVCDRVKPSPSSAAAAAAISWSVVYYDQATKCLADLDAAWAELIKETKQFVKDKLSAGADGIPAAVETMKALNDAGLIAEIRDEVHAAVQIWCKLTPDAPNITPATNEILAVFKHSCEKHRLWNINSPLPYIKTAAQYIIDSNARIVTFVDDCVGRLIQAVANVHISAAAHAAFQLHLWSKYVKADSLELVNKNKKNFQDNFNSSLTDVVDKMNKLRHSDFNIESPMRFLKGLQDLGSNELISVLIDVALVDRHRKSFYEAVDRVATFNVSTDFQAEKFKELKGRREILAKLRDVGLGRPWDAATFEYLVGFQDQAIQIAIAAPGPQFDGAAVESGLQTMKHLCQYFNEFQQRYNLLVDCTIQKVEHEYLSKIRQNLLTVTAQQVAEIIKDVFRIFYDKIPTIQQPFIVAVERVLREWIAKRQAVTELAQQFQDKKEILNALEDLFKNEKGKLDARQRREKLSLDQVKAAIKCDGGFEDDEQTILFSALDEYEKRAHELLDNYYLSGTFVDKKDYTTIAAARKELLIDIRTTLEKARTSPNELNILLVQLCVLWCLVTIHPDYHAQKDENIKRNLRQLPYPAQFAAMYMMLALDQQEGNGYAYDLPLNWQGPSNKFPSDANLPKHRIAKRRQLFQVLTGGGKSLIICICSSFFALLGINSEVACYSSYLSTRDSDSEDLTAFRQLLQVDGRIKYRTIDEIMERYAKSVRSIAANLVSKREDPAHAVAAVAGGASASGAVAAALTSPNQAAAIDDDKYSRILFVDEVDVFFTPTYYGNTFDAGFRVLSPEIADLILFIYEEWVTHRRCNDLTVSNHPKFNAVIQKFGYPLFPAIVNVTRMLINNVQRFSAKEYHVDVDANNNGRIRIGYIDGSNVDYDASHPNETVFAYIKAFKDNNMMLPQDFSNDKVNPIGIDLYCGLFSYVDVITGDYPIILGLTGTLDAAAKQPGGEKILETLRFGRRVYIPSTFADNDKKFFNKDSDVKIFDTEENYIKGLAEKAQELKQKKCATLIYFRNVAELNAFDEKTRVAYNLHYHKLLATMTQTERQNMINVAVAEGSVCLTIRGYGRGVDFKPREGVKVVVIQAFFSSMVTEEIQIQGRTARNGQLGQYFIFTFADDVERRFRKYFKSAEFKALKEDAYYDHLSKLRKLSMEEYDADVRANRLAYAQRRHKVSLGLITFLYSKDHSIENKIREIARVTVNYIVAPLHCSFVIDSSGSIEEDNKWTHLRNAFNMCIQTLRDFQKHSLIDIYVTIMYFSHKCIIYEQNVSTTSVLEIPAKPPMSSHTSFVHAFEGLHATMKKDLVRARGVVFFLTDGVPTVVNGKDAIQDTQFTYAAPLKNLLTNMKQNLESVNLIVFGSDQERQNALPYLQRIKDECEAPEIKVDCTIRDAAIGTVGDSTIDKVMAKLTKNLIQNQNVIRVRGSN